MATRESVENVSDFSDDRIVMNKLLNKNPVTEEEFKRIMYDRFPLLAEKKPDTLIWRNYYLDSILYISKLMEEFNFPYIPHKDFSPKELYQAAIGKSPEEAAKFLWNNGFYLAADSGNIPLLDHIVKRHPKLPENLFKRVFFAAAERGDLNTYKYLETVPFYDHSGQKRYIIGSDRSFAIDKAVRAGQHEMMKYIIRTDPDPRIRTDAAFNLIINNVTDLATLEVLGEIYGKNIAKYRSHFKK